MNDLASESRFVKAIVNGILGFRYFSSALLSAAITIVAFVGAFPEGQALPKKALSILIFLVIGQIVSIIFDIARRKKEKHQRESRATFEANLAQSISALKAGLTVSLCNLLIEQGVRDPSCRATIYAHNEANRTFVPLARFSTNPSLAERGRQSYPADQGIIGLAFKTGAVVKKYSVDDEKRKEEYVSLGMDRQVVDRLRMNSRSMIGLRVNAIDGDSGKPPIGVLIVEHEDRTALSAVHMDSMAESLVFSTMRQLLEPVRQQLIAIETEAQS